jgi:hypothetical protein
MDDIPSMGGRQIGPFLQRAAADVPGEWPSWRLGPGWVRRPRNWRVVCTARRPRLRCTAMTCSQQARWKSGVPGQRGFRSSSVRIRARSCRTLLAPLGVPVTLHRGNIIDATWPGGEIGLYVDDAAKTPSAFYCALDTFAPGWVPGRTTVVLMDYTFYTRLDSPRARRRHRVQEDFVTRHAECFERLDVPEFEGMSCAAFRYVKQLPLGLIRLAGTTLR